MILLARTTPLERVTKKSDGMSIFLVDMREALTKGLTLRPIRNMVNHETNEVFIDNLEIPARISSARKAKASGTFSTPERRAHPDRGRVHRRRLLVHREIVGLRRGPHRIRPADRTEPGHTVSHRARLCQRGSGKPHAREGGGAVRCAPAVRRAGEHGQAARRGRVMGSRQRVRADARRLRLRRSNMMSSASFARRACTRLRRYRPI